MIHVFKTPRVDFSAVPYTVCIGSSIRFKMKAKRSLARSGNLVAAQQRLQTRRIITMQQTYNVTLIGSIQYSTGNACMDNSQWKGIYGGYAAGRFLYSDTLE